MSDHTKVLELGFHHALPGWCKIFGLKSRVIPECEGGGVMVEEAQARSIVDSAAIIEKQAAKIEEYREALRKRVIRKPSDSGYEMCAQCGKPGDTLDDRSCWPLGDPEKHKPGCYAAPA